MSHSYSFLLLIRDQKNISVKIKYAEELLNSVIVFVLQWSFLLFVSIGKLSIIGKLPGCPQAEKYHQHITRRTKGYLVHLCSIHLLLSKGLGPSSAPLWAQGHFLLQIVPVTTGQSPICVHQVQTTGEVSNRNEEWQTSTSDLQHF